MKPAIALVLGTLSLSGCAASGAANDTTLATASLRDPAGKQVATAVLTVPRGVVTLRIEASGLPQGANGIHLHAVGRCDGPDFVSAGPHLNPHGRQHGRQNPAGTHLGDLPNLVIDASGRGELRVELPGSRSENESALFDADGSAIVLHAKADDNVTDPSGNSGPRIACGVLTRG